MTSVINLFRQKRPFWPQSIALIVFLIYILGIQTGKVFYNYNNFPSQLYFIEGMSLSGHIKEGFFFIFYLVGALMEHFLDGRAPLR